MAKRNTDRMRVAPGELRITLAGRCGAFHARAAPSAGTKLGSGECQFGGHCQTNCSGSRIAPDSRLVVMVGRLLPAISTTDVTAHVYADRKDSRGNDINTGYAERTTFVVDRDGRIAATVGGVSPAENVQQALEAVQKLKASH